MAAMQTRGDIHKILTGKQVKSTRQKEMYLVENAYEPIIDQEIFGKVQRMKGQIKRMADMKMKL